MLNYDSRLKEPARGLRNHQTDSEQILWSRLRRKQLLGVQFYRKRPIGKYIVDFFAPSAKPVIEIDGSQHLRNDQLRSDLNRDQFFSSLGLTVLRFDSRETILQIDSVVELIYSTLLRPLNPEIPPCPPFTKGEIRKSQVAKTG